MNINITKNEGAATITLDGRLDTLTAPMLDEIYEKELTGVKELVLDCEGLEYVSSAGLRQLLRAKKIMDMEAGSMKLVNVKEIVNEVFEITGFSEILTIE